MLLPIFDFTITFKPSHDYLKLILLIHLITMVVLLHSSFSIMAIFIILLLLLTSAKQMIRYPMPSPYLTLSYQRGYWFLHDAHKQQYQFEEVCIRFDAGWFVLLTFKNSDSQKSFIIFSDQISITQNKLLRLIGTVNK